ncbi:hypothetical protein [Pseudoalteromonas distincta]|uniref:hypothetical protein n=1 Tax=Pseudoalteromonas distincta TaxID=77608 RepID=UPI0039EB25E3
MNKHIVLSFLASFIAFIVVIFGLLWVPEQHALLTFEVVSLVFLLFNSVSITRWVYKNNGNTRERIVALLCTGSLLLCIGGDVVNFNLLQQYYTHGNVIKHDYLVDSILFFAPGYMLLLLASFFVLKSKVYYSNRTLGVYFIIAICISVVSFYSMYIPEAASYTLVLTWVYSLIITGVGLTSVLLVKSYGVSNAPLSVWVLSLGLAFAALADALIGLFWIYGNGGEGFYPHIRYINWLFYIISQSIVIHLPKVMVMNVQNKGY